MKETRSHASPGAWRAYMAWVYRHLLQRCPAVTPPGRSLKTDLFEEAITPHHLLPDLGAGSIGVDCSPAIVQAAHERLAAEGNRHLLVVADLRRLPLKSGTISRILSGSSLDHFPGEADLAAGMGELARVLAPAGTLIVTLDNPHNPVVWLRNHLPFGWLNRLRLVPYYVGATYSQPDAGRRFEALGLTVTGVTAIAHVPRLCAIWLAAAAERLGWAPLEILVEHALDKLEFLERWPTRYQTGYYLAFRAEKRTGLPMPETH